MLSKADSYVEIILYVVYKKYKIRKKVYATKKVHSIEQWEKCTTM